MKHLWLLFIFLFLSTGISYSQVTNLTVNSSTNNFTMVSGNQLSWSYTVPNNGDTTLIEIWIDTDQNGVLNTSTDVLWNYFFQIDGDNHGQNGPPDIDGTANGQVSFQQNVGLAPAHYIMVFKNHNSYSMIAGNVTALSSPTFSISGHVSVPGGTNAQYVVLNLGVKDGNNFWTGITDASGNYTIQMNSDTTGNPWRLEIDNKIIFGSDIVSPDRINLTLDAGVKTSYTGNDFTVTSAAASVSGTVKDVNGDPVVSFNVYLSGNDGAFNRNASTDTAGVYHLGLLSNEVPFSNLSVGVGDSYDTTIVSAYHEFSVVNSGNNLTQDFTLFKANSTISGRVTVESNSPAGPVQVYGSSTDSANVQTTTDANGYFTLHVSDQIYNYTIFLGNTPVGYVFPNPVAHPGDTNVNINLTLTDVKLVDSGIPKTFALSQNYPNPFNPSTKIQYEIPKASFVHLTVYNVIGQQVAELVNHEQSPGKYSVTFDGANVTSGIYFYRIEAGSFVQTNKMILLK
jgi:hypothetical protein